MKRILAFCYLPPGSWPLPAFAQKQYKLAQPSSWVATVAGTTSPMTRTPTACSSPAART